MMHAYRTPENLSILEGQRYRYTDIDSLDN